MQGVAHIDSTEEDERIFALRVRVGGGQTAVLPAIEGLSLMELLRANDVPIVAECGGAAVCASCHVRIAAHWLDQLPPVGDEEASRLDDIPTASDDSRLACQIRMTADLDGLEVELQPDSIKS
jgi:2Fe-2S ferredoxin